MNPRRISALLVVGILGGVLSGMFGVGGGIIMVPLLLTLGRIDQRQAAATSLAAVVPTSVVGAVAYGLAGHVDVIAGLVVAAGGVAGSLIGTRLLRALPVGWLRWLFIALLLLVAARLFFEVPERGAAIAYTWYSIVGLLVLGLVMGIASGLFGIGGGVIVVPVLVAVFGASDLLAKGTSLLALLPAAVIGSTANVRAHLLWVRTALLVGIPAALASFGGSALALLLSPQTSTILFAILILAAAAQMVVRAVRRQRTPPADADGIAAPAED
ncbi:sulfite exporter TauE/SafE family protein [Pseudolysinimonas kribbensis]|uniref:Probable membrane transporter protein n=1 Tax=Pseudolysinimonas kribbensis TaxID=433641 RepID=A0ABQ6K0H4_9MICO|nr:sulfite exporter TauE/SafE family protein [Pseudolysinimonas kribbensis]GMA94095.1 UPF0721 transmembrane protein [Pseudolysinimonas kribbensis]